MRKKKVAAQSLAHTKALAIQVAGELIARGPAAKGATVVGLYGDLGAGKTTFTKEVAQYFGITRTVASPTFVLERIYKLAPKYKFKHLIHIDAYRLSGGAELKALGWKEIISDRKNLIFIEWPEIVIDAMPKKHIGIFFTHKGEFEREIELHLL